MVTRNPIGTFAAPCQVMTATAVIALRTTVVTSSFRNAILDLLVVQHSSHLFMLRAIRNFVKKMSNFATLYLVYAMDLSQSLY